MTPSDIEVLLHCHVTNTPHPRSEAPAVKEAIGEFLQQDLIRLLLDHHSGAQVYTTTDRGVAHVKLLCGLPLPRKAWTNESGEVIK